MVNRTIYFDKIKTHFNYNYSLSGIYDHCIYGFSNKRKDLNRIYVKYLSKYI